MAKPEFSRNETVSLMHQDKVFAFRSIADYLEKYKDEYTIDEVVKFLREIADEEEAQMIVVNLRDEINPAE